MKTRQILAIILCTMMISLTLFTPPAQAATHEDLVICIYNKTTDKTTYIQYDTLVKKDNLGHYIMLSKIAEVLGYTTKWYESVNMVELSKENDFISVQIDKAFIIRNNKQTDTALQTRLFGNKTYVSLFDMLDVLEIPYSVEKSVVKIELDVNLGEEFISKNKATDDEIYLLAKLVDFETGSGSLLKRVAVSNVVFNRLNSPNFPNTISEIIYARNQFPPAYYSRFASHVPSEKSLLAAKLAMVGRMEVPDCLYFNYIPFTSKNLIFYKKIEGDYFYQQSK